MFCQLAAYTSATNFASPKEFIPARWLPGSDIKPHNANVFYPFSVGPRDCVGKNFALAEVRLILTKLLWNFDLRLGEKEWDWDSQKAFLVWDKQPLYLELRLVDRK
jgi:cytochrome P450